MMDPQKNHYHLSFFKPTTDSARRNRNMVVQLVLIWAVAIFGFQFLLKIVEKPVPEPAFTAYLSSWQDMESGKADLNDYKIIGQSALSVLGKVAIDPDHRLALDNGISWMAYRIADSTQRSSLMNGITVFERMASTVEDIRDPDYVARKMELFPLMEELFGLDPADVRVRIAPLEMKSSLMGSFDADSRKVFAEAMELYLVHNRSFLTDTRFLGFPFHYFYTAVFLLILFVGLCWLYCVRTDMFNRKYGVED
jgi:putative solute:sodium symporter small subunit